MRTSELNFKLMREALATIEQEIIYLEAKEAKPESATTDCSADGSAAPTPTKPGVQPAGPEQTLEKLRTYMKKEFGAWHSSTLMGFPEKELRVRRQITREYRHMLDIIEGEAGVAQDERSRPAG